MLAPILDELAEEYSGKVSFTRLDVEQNPKTASKYQIRSIPTLLLFKKGEPVSHIVGYKPKADLKRELDAALT
jgi:thioredoxin 1